MKINVTTDKPLNKLFRLTPLTKLGELGSKLVHYCFLKPKTGVQVKANINTCYFHEGSTKRVQVI